MFDVIFLTCHLEEKKYSTVVPILDTLLMVIGPIVGYIEAPPFGGNLWLKIITGNSTRIGAGARRRSSLQLLRNAKMIWKGSQLKAASRESSHTASVFKGIAHTQMKLLKQH